MFTASASFHGEKTKDSEALGAETREMWTGSKAQLSIVLKVTKQEKKRIKC